MGAVIRLIISELMPESQDKGRARHIDFNAERDMIDDALRESDPCIQLSSSIRNSNAKPTGSKMPENIARLTGSTAFIYGVFMA